MGQKYAVPDVRTGIVVVQRVFVGMKQTDAVLVV